MGLEKLAELKNQLPIAPNTPKPAKPKKTNDIDPIVLIISRLQKLFPNTFTINPAPKVPLKIGILDDLTARSDEIGISKEDLCTAVQTWCRSKRYWAVTIEGAQRIDLYGNPSGLVDAKGAAQARAMERKNKQKIIKQAEQSAKHSE